MRWARISEAGTPTSPPSLPPLPPLLSLRCSVDWNPRKVLLLLSTVYANLSDVEPRDIAAFIAAAGNADSANPGAGAGGDSGSGGGGGSGSGSGSGAGGGSSSSGGGGGGSVGGEDMFAASIVKDSRSFHVNNFSSAAGTWWWGGEWSRDCCVAMTLKRLSQLNPLNSTPFRGFSLTDLLSAADFVRDNEIAR